MTAQEFRAAMGHFATGVTVISAAHDGAVHAATVCAVTPVTLEPPSVLVCLNRTSDTESAIRASGHFVINVLTAKQIAVADACAGKGGDKLRGIGFEYDPGGAPVVADALAHLSCAVTDTQEIGTHSLFLGGVERTDTNDGDPLTVFRGRYGRLTGSLEDAA